MSDQLTKRETDYAQWYNDLVLKADLAEHSDVPVPPMVLSVTVAR